MRRLLMVATGLLACAVVSARAEMKPEDVVKARQGMMEAVYLNAGVIGQVVKGTVPLTPQLADYAENIAALAKVLPITFTKGFADLNGSNAKSEAFDNPSGNPKIVEGYRHLAEMANKIAAAARANDLATVKADFGELGKVCKGCHDTFRKS